MYGMKNIKRFIKDRICFLILYFFVTVIINTYMISLNAIRANIGDLVYLNVLIILIYILGIFIDYKKWSKKYFELYNMLKSNYDMPDNANEDDAETAIIKSIIKQDDEKYDEAVRDSIKRVKDMEEYISKWVHEIKIPISALNLILESIDDAEMEERIKIEVEKMNFLVNSVMYGSRSTASAEDIFLKQENLSDVVKQCIKSNAFMLIKNNIDIQIENIDYDIYTDKKWILYILDQLVNNSIKYVDKNKEKNTLEFRGNESKKYIELIIEDNGIGIAEQDLDRVFEKGFTGINGRNTVYKSTGMGLYFSSNIIKKLEHEMSVQSVKGSYTRFIIRFYKVADYLKVRI